MQEVLGGYFFDSHCIISPTKTGGNFVAHTKHYKI